MSTILLNICNIIEGFFAHLQVIDDIFWSYIGFSLVVILGFYFTLRSRFYQFRTLTRLPQTIRDLQGNEGNGVHPLRLYFASVGGMIGLGNVVAVITALLVGGPGALFWLWVASICGMLIKYAEIYLGVKFRVPNAHGGYDGGPMYFLAHAFNIRTIPIIVAVLLCIYGVEVYQFVILADTLSSALSAPKYIVIGLLLAFVIYTAIGGVNRLATVCMVLMPIFLISYLAMCFWVMLVNLPLLPEMFSTIIHSAFSGHAALGGFAGSTFILAAQSGIARAVYSGDIGIGYDATLQSETRAAHPERQARLAIFALATDTLVCSLSILVVMVTGLWHSAPDLQASEFVAQALSNYFPYMNHFMVVFFFLAGFTTIIAFFTVGMKCARFLSSQWGEKIYMVYAIGAFSFFSFFDQSKVMLIMSVSGGLLMMFNLVGIARLRNHIEFK